MNLKNKKLNLLDMFQQVNDVMAKVQKGYIEPVEGTIEVFNITNIPFLTCSYCGKKYHSNRHKMISCCDNDSCRKLMRRDVDRLRLEANPEKEREKNRFRQQQFRENKKQKTPSEKVFE